MKQGRIIGAVFLSLFLFAGTGLAQAPPRKPPVLIRDTGVAEGKTNAEEAVKKEHNPMLAEENIKIGDFYFKRKNYVAAIARYREALEYQPNLYEAHDALGRAYEKNGENQKALAVYESFLKNYPESSKAEEFRSRCAKLKKKK